MFTTRRATVADADLVTHQRTRMFIDSGQSDDERMSTVAANFAPWIRRKLETGEYLGWIASQDEQVVGGAGLLLMDFPPHFLDPNPVRAYLLNFYVDPDFRSHGIARALLDLAMEETRKRGVYVVTLHASVYGKPIYERYGFQASNEMMFRNTSEAQ